MYANFLRFRYFFNPHTRSAFALISARLDTLILPPNGNPKIPPQAVQAYTLLQGAITRFGMAAVQQPGDHGAASAAQ